MYGVICNDDQEDKTLYVLCLNKSLKQGKLLHTLHIKYEVCLVQMYIILNVDYPIDPTDQPMIFWNFLVNRESYMSCHFI